MYNILLRGKFRQKKTLSIWKTILGGAAGMALGGPVGALIGAAIVHFVGATSQTKTDHKRLGGMANSHRAVAFATTVIALSAKMAKADGVVTRDEVNAFKQIFETPAESSDFVSKLFNQARQEAAGFEPYAYQLRDLFPNPEDKPTLENVIGLLFHIAKADGVVDTSELLFLQEVADILGFSAREFQGLKDSFIGSDDIDPYAVLGLERNCTAEEAKARYRKLLRENHPDILTANGMPEEAVTTANERMAAINLAYELVKKRF